MYISSYMYYHYVGNTALYLMLMGNQSCCSDEHSEIRSCTLLLWSHSIDSNDQKGTDERPSFEIRILGQVSTEI